MKKSPKGYLLVLLIIVCACLSECKQKFSYIDKYLGSWQFTYINHTLIYTRPYADSSLIYDTIVYDGVINRGSGGNEIIIKYTDQDQLTVHLAEDGILLDQCYPPADCNGKFIDVNTFEYHYGARVMGSSDYRIIWKAIYGIKLGK